MLNSSGEFNEQQSHNWINGLKEKAKETLGVIWGNMKGAVGRHSVPHWFFILSLN